MQSFNSFHSLSCETRIVNWCSSFAIRIRGSSSGVWELPGSCLLKRFSYHASYIKTAPHTQIAIDHNHVRSSYCIGAIWFVTSPTWLPMDLPAYFRQAVAFKSETPLSKATAAISRGRHKPRLRPVLKIESWATVSEGHGFPEVPAYFTPRLKNLDQNKRDHALRQQ